MLHNKDSHGEVAMKREKREKKKEINKSHEKKRKQKIDESWRKKRLRKRE